MRRSVLAGLGMVGVMTVAACGHEAIDARSTVASAPVTTTTSQLPIVTPDKLDAGAYPTKPRAPLGNAGTAAAGAALEAQRLADVVVGPWEVDKSFIGPYLDSFYVMTTPAVLASIGPQPVATAAAPHQFVNGFASARQAQDKTAMVDAVLRFADPAAASAAAADMAAAAASVAIMGATPTKTDIPGHPDAAASTYPFTAHGADRAATAVRAFTPHGPFVIMQFVQAVDLPAAGALVAKAIDAQVPRIDQFAPAPLTALADVPVDPTGLLARTLPMAGDASAAKNAVYQPRGASQFQSDPVASKTLFSDTGVDEVAMAGANVYQAKNPGAALMIINSFSDELSKTEGTTIAAPVRNLPGSFCVAFPKGFYCVAPADRYAIEVSGEQYADVQQKVSAQYIMLTAK